MAAHIPGPWKACETNQVNYMGDTHNVDVVYQAEQIGGDPLAFVVLGADAGVAVANSNLIAAAPEMLDALHHILNIEGACFGADESWNLDWHWAKVRDAIAKAEGR